MATLSDSYARTLALMDKSDLGAASAEFNGRFVPAVKKLYSEAASTYPVRFSKVKEWCDWSKTLYKQTLLTAKALQSKKQTDAQQNLQEIRQLFYKIHAEAELLKNSDYIFLFKSMVGKDNPNAEKVTSIIKMIEGAAPSVKTKAEPDAYKQALTSWKDQVAEIIKDNSISPDELTKLRTITESLYRQYGVQFQ